MFEMRLCVINVTFVSSFSSASFHFCIYRCNYVNAKGQVKSNFTAIQYQFKTSYFMSLFL